MKRILILIFLFLSLPIPPKNADGAYNTFSRLFYCESENICLHEIGHAIDQKLGWPSSNPEFIESAKSYSDVNVKNSEEFYAWIYAFCDGDLDKIPDKLRPFYSDEKVIELVKIGEHKLYILRYW